MIQRNEYLNKLISWKDEQVIKVITGIRRCGKSTLLELYREHLKSTGITDEQIIELNFENPDNDSLLDYKALYNSVNSRLCKDKMTYIFLDEVQTVPEFQKAVDGLYIKKNTDVYITGSNAYLLSGELATLLSGRYVEISMLPFSYKEYCEIRSIAASDESFNQYMMNGGFPYVSVMKPENNKIDDYIEGIYHTVLFKDIEERQKRREPDPAKRKVTDPVLLANISKYLASVVGSPVSIKSIADYLSSNGRPISAHTVDDYTDALVEAYIYYPVERMDIVGKQLLKTNKKYYSVDMGLRNHLLPKRKYDIGFSVENIVYLELLRRGYKVNIGKSGTSEVDFVAKKDDAYSYFQITATMLDQSTFDREMKPLRSISDNYEKKVLTLDKIALGNYEGIIVQNVIEWLMS
ncbi:MAG TPA: ATP-binding protein [Bacillota bacterium]|nr:ATP-binding protein [Bacillota bacterium]